MRRRTSIITLALVLLLTALTVPAAHAANLDLRQPLGFQSLLSWASQWFTSVWQADDERGPSLDPDGNATSADPVPADPDTDDDRGPSLDPDG
jgi:hypothetical protein